jgi:Putative general bacterial porin
MKRFLILGCFGVALVSSFANAYRWEMDAKYYSSKAENSITDTFGSYVNQYKEESSLKGNFLAGTYYFSPVETKEGPLAETSYIGKNSSISLVSGALKSKYVEQEKTTSPTSEYRGSLNISTDFNVLSGAFELYVSFFNLQQSNIKFLLIIQKLFCI